MIDPKALFIGPFGENRKEFQNQVNRLLEDIIHWRRNFHPADNRSIAPSDKRKKSWQATFDQLADELDKLSGDLKQSVPIHHPRYLGHMLTGDLTIPSIIGHLAGILYNQNNIVGEVASVTLEKELGYIHYLCEMVGYETSEFSDFWDRAETSSNIGNTLATGHLTSGGTTANIEALWVARNMKYFPLSVKLLSANKTKISKILKLEADEINWLTIIDEVSAVTIDGEPISGITAKELFGISPEKIFNLSDDFKKCVEQSIHNQIKKKYSDPFKQQELNTANKVIFNKCFLKLFGVGSLGVHGIHEAINDTLGENVSLPVVLVPQSRHYSWEKAMDIVGIGSGQIRYVNVDQQFSIDETDFGSKCDAEKHILMAVAVAGTTEEGAIDPIDKMIDIREDLSKEGKSFSFHVDAAYGGYYASMFQYGENYEEWNNYIQNNASLKQHLESTNSGIRNRLIAIAGSDSITIDPHKMGYVPYAVGAILYKDRRAKGFISKKAPYLASSDSSIVKDPATMYMGESTLEGSRSGASALACYLTAKVINNDVNGYGYLMAETIAQTQDFLKAFKKFNKKHSKSDLNFKIQPLYDPQTNVVCYAVSVPNFIDSPEHLNLLTERLYQEMSVSKNKSVYEHKFIVSKTTLPLHDGLLDHGYKEQIEPILKAFKITQKPKKNYNLVILRSVLMNPLLGKERVELFDEFTKHLEDLARKILPELLLEILKEKNNGNRLKVLWIENKNSLDHLRRYIEAGKTESLNISNCLNITFQNEWNNETINAIKTNQVQSRYDVFIVDLNLRDPYHKEMTSGIKVIRDILSLYKNKCSSPHIIVYSQFLGEQFSNDQSQYSPLPLKRYLQHYADIPEDFLIGKTLTPIRKSNTFAEMEDLEKIIIALARTVNAV